MNPRVEGSRADDHDASDAAPDGTAEHAGHRYTRSTCPTTPTGQPDNAPRRRPGRRLGLHDRAIQARLRGDILVTGLYPDRDVPSAVLAAIHHIGPTRINSRAGMTVA